MYFNSTDDEARVYDGTDWVALGGAAPSPSFSASGGSTNTYTLNSVNYKSHTFTSPGTFTVSSGSASCDILVVAGGGGGGYSHGGGGGAGGYRTVTQTLTGPLSISVTVGAGGAVGTSPSRKGTNGGNSVFASPSPITSTGGGGGSSYPSGGTGNLVALAVVAAVIICLMAMETLRQPVRHKAIPAVMDLSVLGMVVEEVALVRLVLQLAAPHQAAALLGLVVLDRQTTIGLVKMSPMQVVAAVVLGEVFHHQAMQAALVVVAVERVKTMPELTVPQTRVAEAGAVAPETHLPVVAMVVQGCGG